MRRFESLSEQEVLALAISLEEEDARIFDDFAVGLRERYPEQAAQFDQLRREEDAHRHRLLTLYRSRFGDHVPLIRREDVRGFVRRRAVWLVRPLGLKAVQREAELIELETKRFYEAAARRTGSGSCLATWPRRSAITPRLPNASAPRRSARRNRPSASGCSCCRSCNRDWPD
jgi:rubrerythrin